MRTILLLAALLAAPQPRISVNGTPALPNRPTLNLVGQVTCADNARLGSKDCTITGNDPAVAQPIIVQLTPTAVDVAAPWVTDTSVIVCGVEGPYPALTTITGKTPGVGFSVLVQAAGATIDSITLDCLGGTTQ